MKLNGFSICYNEREYLLPLHKEEFGDGFRGDIAKGRGWNMDKRIRSLHYRLYKSIWIAI